MSKHLKFLATPFSDKIQGLRANAFRVNLAIIASAIIISLWPIPYAFAVTQELQFDSLTGYTVKTIFSYSDTQNSTIIHEQGKGKTQTIDSMRVSFYKPSGEAIALYDNVADGIARGNYFQFSFDPATQKLLGNIDLGGESPGEIYLKGESNGELSLMKIAPSGEEKAIDRINNYQSHNIK